MATVEGVFAVSAEACHEAFLGVFWGYLEGVLVSLPGKFRQGSCTAGE